ncbi:hypothetical protein [Niallia sp. NCCP-28]|uniref:hypothetical protein n=1 Tax=Niallia sp. NCCP-28 TaxID=2934712 RepID=UPI002082A114|nr:hypothetical protein [Niallia sp. NCCP-28]GKU82140.1 hypothetical protein NCCP28_15360 [Niallia sp. NCCP-28]
MSVTRILVGLWRSYEETSEEAKYPELKTRYYRKNREKMIEYIKQVVNQKLPNWKIKKVDEERGEIVLEKQGIASSVMIVTVYKINAIKSAIDIYCSKEGSLGDFGSSYKNIMKFFSALHTEIQPENS